MAWLLKLAASRLAPWILVAIGLAVMGAIGGHFLQVSNLRADVAAARLATAEKETERVKWENFAGELRGGLEAVTANRDAILGQIADRNREIANLKLRQTILEDDARDRARRALESAERERTAILNDPTSGPERMNRWLAAAFPPR